MSTSNTPAPKRARACDACHALKIRCELGSSTSAPPPCSRCVRLGKECTITPPKRQKDRVAELEAQVAALTKLLEAQGLRDADLPTESSHPTAQGQEDVGAKRRRVDDEASPGNSRTYSKTDAPEHHLSRLDEVIPPDVQMTILDKFRRDLTRTFPVTPLKESETYHTLRSEKPALLAAMVYAASSGLIDREKQEAIANIFMGSGGSIISDSPRTLSLLQAIIVTCLYYRTPTSHRYVAIYYLVHLAQAVTKELAIATASVEPSTSALPTLAHISAPEAWRALLGVYLLSSSGNVFLRRSDADDWTQQHTEYLQMLDYSQEAMPSDRLLCQHLRAQRLSVQIAKELQFADRQICLDISSQRTQETMLSLQGRLLDWQFQVPVQLRSDPTVMFWQYAITLYINEPVLHTPTNKHSFRAPYLVEGLSVTDIPCPRVTPAHATAMRALIGASHSLIDMFVALDTPTLMAIPAFLFVSRVAYAIFLLVKLYVAVTAASGTYGAVVLMNEIRVEEHIEKLVKTAERVRVVDRGVGASRILRAAERLQEWLEGYKAAFFATAADPLDATPDLTASLETTPPETVADQFNPTDNLQNWDDILSRLPDDFDFSVDALLAAQKDFTTEPIPELAENEFYQHHTIN